jgi:hypothetical protein
MARVMEDPGSLLRAVRLAVLLALVSAVVIAGSPAYACSCAEPDLATWLTEADGAFIGRWVDRAEISGGMAAVTFEVEQVVKGAFGPKAIVRTNAQGSACGMEQLGASRTGLLLQRGSDGVWESNLCSMVAPAQLLAVGGDLPPDPAIAPVSAGWEPVSLLAIVVSAVVVAIVGLLWLRRRRASFDGTSLT